jgi:hypothetical protein
MHDDDLTNGHDDFECPKRQEKGRSAEAKHPLASYFEMAPANFARWWSTPGADRDWIELGCPDGSGSFLAWWQLASHQQGSDERSLPRIEIAGLAPPARGCDTPPDLVQTVGWWVDSAVPMTEARRWFSLGLLDLNEGKRWSSVTQSVLYERGALDYGLTVQADHQRWLLSDTGYATFVGLRSAGVSLAHLGLVACANLGLHEPLSPYLDHQLEVLDRDLTRPMPGALAPDECPRGTTVGRRSKRAPGQVGRVPHTYRPTETYGIRMMGAPRREYCWHGE